MIDESIDDVDDTYDADDGLPSELEGVEPTADVPADEVDEPDPAVTS